jgi:hypothetical protein
MSPAKTLVPQVKATVCELRLSRFLALGASLNFHRIEMVAAQRGKPDRNGASRKMVSAVVVGTSWSFRLIEHANPAVGGLAGNTHRAIHVRSQSMFVYEQQVSILNIQIDPG